MIMARRVPMPDRQWSGFDITERWGMCWCCDREYPTVYSFIADLLGSRSVIVSSHETGGFGSNELGDGDDDA